VTVPFGTNVTALVATHTDTGISEKVGAVTQVSGTTANNFTSPVSYIVSAADGSTATYVVTVTLASSSAKVMSTFSLAGGSSSLAVTSGTISGTAIAVTVPNATNVTALVATFTSTGASVKIGAVVQASAVTANNFTSPVAYTVTAADGSTVIYTVTVTVAASTSVLPGAAGATGANATNPTVISANPSNLDTNVPTSIRGAIHTNLVAAKSVTATFSGAMDPATINSSPAGTLLTFTLKTTSGNINVPGTVAMNAANTIATFTPTAATLDPNTSYTATITTAAKNTGSVTAMPKAVVWSFTTRATSAANQANPFVGQAPIDLLTAGNFVILAQTAITDVSASVITGDIGLSATAGSSIFVSCAEMSGTSKIYAVDAAYAVTGFAACAMPGPGANKTLVDNAVADKGTAYTEAAGRTSPDATNLGAAEIGGQTFYPGLYKYTGASTINTDVTLDAQGDTNAVWIFQISGDLTVAAGGTVPLGKKVILTNGAKASNVFWQVAASNFGATINAYATFNGVVMSSAQVIANTGAVVNGRMFAATQVTLQQNPVTQPAQ
jgi:hypothetical protein